MRVGFFDWKILRSVKEFFIFEINCNKRDWSI